MADFSTYPQLRDFLRSISHRGASFDDATLDGFIQAADSMVSRRVRAMEMIQTAVLDESVRVDDTPVYSLPADFLGVRSIRQGGTTSSIEPVSLDRLNDFRLSGPACFAAIYGFNIEFRGNPAQGEEFDLIYFARMPTFSEANTHDLLTNQPDLYSNAALYWLYLHVRQLQLAQAHANAFDLVVGEVNLLASQQRGSAGTAPSNNLGHRARSSM